MVAIQSVTVTGSAASSITFGTGGTIPQTYTDLMIVANTTTSYVGTDAGYIFFNGDNNSAHYSVTRLYGNGSTASSDRYSAPYAIWMGDGSGSAILHIMNYANTTTYKTVLARSGSPTADANIVGATVTLWRGSTGSATQAITSITLQDVSGNFQVGSTFTLYGIANADIGAYATGGIITQDSNYYYHTFGNTSTFTPSRALTADILVVAGGGGGAGGDGGGAGAGGLLTFASQSLSSGTGYTCTVGAGGAYGTNPGQGSNGGNSSFGAISGTVYGGGGGGYSGSTPSGGSGGGAVGSGSVSVSGGAGTSGQGNAGGSNYINGSYGPAGGGGGAGTAGGNAGPTTGGNGGNGVTSALLNAMALATSTGALDSSSGNYYYAGGGGGWVSGGTVGLGGKGGGGNANTSSAAPATPYTGGGGGAGVPNGGLGGSGIIIVRYLK
jgi:hypothetical protein